MCPVFQVSHGETFWGMLGRNFYKLQTYLLSLYHLLVFLFYYLVYAVFMFYYFLTCEMSLPYNSGSITSNSPVASEEIRAELFHCSRQSFVYTDKHVRAIRTSSTCCRAFLPLDVLEGYIRTVELQHTTILSN